MGPEKAAADTLTSGQISTLPIRAAILTAKKWSLSTPKARAKPPPNPTSNSLHMVIPLTPVAFAPMGSFLISLGFGGSAFSSVAKKCPCRSQRDKHITAFFIQSDHHSLQACQSETRTGNPPASASAHGTC